jgi:tetratricopeptide (TPR) repeat protein
MSGKQTPDRQEAVHLSELLNSYLRRQATAQAEGLACPEPTDVVLPYDSAPVQPVDAPLAWADGLGVLRYFPDRPQGLSLKAPPDWPQLVAAQEPAVALPFALGTFPQLVRNLQPLLTADDLPALRQPAPRPIGTPALRTWAGNVQEPAEILLAAGVLRLAGEVDQAAALLNRAAQLPAEWQALRANEEAALCWHQGQCDEALRRWQAQAESVPVLFNRGMASLFLGQPAPAREALAQAVQKLPETSAWHHLASLYLTLATARA